MNKNKKRMRAHRRNAFFNNKPIFCKINVKEGKTKVFEFKGKLEEGWKQFKRLCVDQYQIDNTVTMDFSLVIDGLNQLKIPTLPLYNSEKNDRRNKKK